MPFKNIAFLKILRLVIAVLFVQSCANIVAPNGGAKDVRAPQIVPKKSSANLQTNFKKQRIVLTFDEWIKLEDIFNQVVVSPPLNERPEVTLHNKSVWFEFAKEEILRENATYTLNFGNAVKDLNEGNPAVDLRFVFSTGSVIDSLEVTGRVVDALKGEPQEGVLLMLYDNLADSVVRKVKPFYFSRTDKSGSARIQNIRAGTFKVFALKDNDLNYLFNQDNEKIGFPDNNLVLSSENAAPVRRDTSVKRDSLQIRKDSIAEASKSINIRLFDPRKPLKMLSKETDKYGVAKIIFNQNITKDTAISFDNVEQKAFTEVSKDTVLVWYDMAAETPWNIYVRGETRNDTVRVRPRGRTDFMKKGNLRPLSIPKGTTQNLLHQPTKPIVFNFNNPIQLLDSQRFTLLDTAKKVIPLSIKQDSASKRKITINAAWVEGMKYSLLILPNAMTDIYGFKSDTIAATINVLKKKDFGDISLEIKGLDKTKSYICQILGGNLNVESEFFIDNKTTFSQRLETVQTGEYTLKIIEDLNKNRIWDTGEYDEKKQPERIFMKKADEVLRSDWELKFEFDISDLK